MQALDGSGRVGFTIIWKIENFSYCWHKKDEPIESACFPMPTVVQNTILKSLWCLRLYPRGHSLNPDNMVCDIRRSKVDGVSVGVVMNYEFAFLVENGTMAATPEIQNKIFFHGEVSEPLGVAAPDDVFQEKFLPTDTLTIRCRVWQRQQTLADPVTICDLNLPTAEQCNLRTKLGVERNSFTWSILNFSSLLKEQKASYFVRSTTSDKALLLIKLYVDKYDKVKVVLCRLAMDMKSCSKCRISVIDTLGHMPVSAEDTHSFNVKEDEWHFPIFISKFKLWAEKDSYLPDDTLSLRFDVGISKEVESNTIDHFIQHPAS